MISAQRTLLSADEIAGVVERLAREISTDHPAGVTVVAVLRASLCFVADLLRSLSVPSVVDFLALSPYAPGQTRARVLKDLDIDISGQDVVLLEHLVDTGLSTSFIVNLLGQRRPRNISVCTLLERPQRRILPLDLNYVGAEAPEDFLVGYGLDFSERYRNLRSIRIVDVDELERDPNGFEISCYRGMG